MDVNRSGIDGIWLKYMVGTQVNDSGRLAFCCDSVGRLIGTSLLIPSFNLVKNCTLLIPIL